MRKPLADLLRSRLSPAAAAVAGVGLLATGAGAPPPQTIKRDVLARATPSNAAAGRLASSLAEERLIKLQDLTVEQARLWNASLPVSRAINPAAHPFMLGDAGALSQLRASDCLTAAVYYEAAQESVPGQQAVAQVVLNRLRHPAFPKTVCGVVFQGSERATGCQFTFTCDGSLARAPSPRAWGVARAVADAALAGYVQRSVGHATHYHADYVAPYWSAELTKVASIGRHVFYRWSGKGGLPPVFDGDYAGVEDDRVAERVRPELVTALHVEVESPPPPSSTVEAPPAVLALAEPASAPDAFENVAAQVGAAAEVVARAPDPAYFARREARPAMPSSLF